jgi:hypothetical protein
MASSIAAQDAVHSAAGEKLADENRLQEPKDDPFTTEELKQFDGSDEGKPIYVAIKGKIFDGSFPAFNSQVGSGWLMVEAQFRPREICTVPVEVVSPTFLASLRNGSI